MKRFLLRVLPFLMLAAVFTGCKKKFDDYYARPEGLEPPIYQVLTAKGNFKSLLALIDKAGYKTTLSAAGYWTMFAPNDDAFTKFYTERGSSIDKIDSSTARAIVQYLLVYNAFTKERIDDYQQSSPPGWVPNTAFRRRTAYYSGFYDDTTSTGQVVKAVAANRNGGQYVTGDNNNKYIPYFTDVYLSGNNLTAADYNYFYPSTQFSGFNVADAKVVTKDVAAENGTIHEIDKVITPLPSIDEYLRSKPEYSEFKKLYDKYMVSFNLNADATTRYKLLTGKPDQVYVKAFSSLLAFSPNNENFNKLQDNDAQQDSWTLFVPKNDVLLNYLNTVVLEFFKTFDGRQQVLADFLNAHMWQRAVWPSKFSSTVNFLKEEARFDPQTDIIDRKILSNGIFYGTNKVQEADVFSSVYARAYLDPKFSLMTRLLDYELKFSITNPKQKITLFMMSDAVLAAAGYSYSTNTNLWSYTVNGTTTTGEAIRQKLLRIISTSVIPKDITSLAGTGIAEAYNNEFIKWNNNRVISIGTQDLNQTVTVDSIRTAKNGRAYYLNGLLTYSDTTIGRHIVKLGGTSAATSDFYYFSQYLLNSSMYNPASGASNGEITGTVGGTFYTIFVPSNAAIIQAVKDGYLPGNITTGIPNVTPTLPTDKELVNRFIQYHILNKRALIPESQESGAFETLLKNAAGDVVPITVITTGPAMRVNDVNNRQANVDLTKSNNLSNRAIIHLIDNYLKYNY